MEGSGGEATDLASHFNQNSVVPFCNTACTQGWELFLCQGLRSHGACESGAGLGGARKDALVFSPPSRSSLPRSGGALRPRGLTTRGLENGGGGTACRRPGGGGLRASRELLGLFRPQGWGLSLSHPLPSSPTLAPLICSFSSRPWHRRGKILSYKLSSSKPPRAGSLTAHPLPCGSLCVYAT